MLGTTNQTLLRDFPRIGTMAREICMSQLEFAIAQMRLARAYVNDLLFHIDSNEWFRQPKEGVTHVAWQVGHLAVA